MKLEEFHQEIQKLIGVYGNDKFPDQKIDAIWEIVSDQSVQWLARIISKLICTHRFSPMPSDFFELVQIEKISRPKPIHTEPFPEPNPKVLELLSEWRKNIRPENSGIS